VLGDVHELLVDLADEELLDLKTVVLAIKRVKVGLHLGGDVAESDLGEVSVRGAVVSGDRSGSLKLNSRVQSQVQNGQINAAKLNCVVPGQQSIGG
jgi:hypothetical protein